LGRFDPATLADLNWTIWALSTRALDATLVLALQAKTAADAQRIWQRAVELVEPTLALNPDRAAEAAVARLAEILPANLAAVLLVEAVCGHESLIAHLKLYPPRPPGYPAIPKILVGRWRDALQWLAARIAGAQGEPKEQ
jgi:hypothetical protein